MYPAVNISGKETEFYHGVELSKYKCSKKHEKVLKTVLTMMGGEDSIPEIMVTDGPHGLCKQSTNADHLGINDSVEAMLLPERMRSCWEAFQSDSAAGDTRLGGCSTE